MSALREALDFLAVEAEARWADIEAEVVALEAMAGDDAEGLIDLMGVGPRTPEADFLLDVVIDLAESGLLGGDDDPARMALDAVCAVLAGREEARALAAV